MSSTDIKNNIKMFTDLRTLVETHHPDKESAIRAMNLCENTVYVRCLISVRGCKIARAKLRLISFSRRKCEIFQIIQQVKFREQIFTTKTYIVHEKTTHEVPKMLVLFSSTKLNH